MPHRSSLGLDEIASLDTLAAAFWRAARADRHGPDASRFAARLDRELSDLRDEILTGRAPEGRWTAFRVYDPKPRRILAPSFRDRVTHHALMAHMGPVLDRALVDDTFACREGKGTLAAVLRAQQHLRRFEWYVKIDIRAYFASVEHRVLLGILARRFKHPALLDLCARILATTPDGPGRGLPIGALRLSLRRRQRYQAARRHWEGAYLAGALGACTLQSRFDGVLAVTAHADATPWRRAELVRRPAVDA